MTTLVVEQPNYVPWMGYFDLIDRADVWVWYDDVQYTRRDWRNRNRVAGDGDPIWLTIPVRTRNHRDQRICDVEIDLEQAWARKHLNTLRHLYNEAPYFEPVFELVRHQVEAVPRLLADLTIDLNQALGRYMGIETEFLRSSRLVGIEGAKEQRILSVCQSRQADVYLSGPSARNYLHPELFEQEGIELRYISYSYQDYPRNGYRPRCDLSILDTLFWIGPVATLELIRASPRDRPSGAG